MVDFRMEVKLIFFKISNKSILFINKLVESFYFLCKHDDFMFKIFDLDLNASVLIESLLKITDL